MFYAAFMSSNCVRVFMQKLLLMRIQRFLFNFISPFEYFHYSLYVHTAYTRETSNGFARVLVSVLLHSISLPVDALLIRVHSLHKGSRCLPRSGYILFLIRDGSARFDQRCPPLIVRRTVLTIFFPSKRSVNDADTSPDDKPYYAVVELGISSKKNLCYSSVILRTRK